jgi:hypothetical protein
MGSRVLSFSPFDAARDVSLPEALSELLARQTEALGELRRFKDKVTIFVAFDVHNESSARSQRKGAGYSAGHRSIAAVPELIPALLH